MEILITYTLKIAKIKALKVWRVLNFKTLKLQE